MNLDVENLGLRWRQMRFNPLRSLTPERLASALDQWAAGWLREGALIFETIENREFMIKSVMNKRRAAVARRDWQIIIPDENDPNAEAHKETLEHFYNNLIATDATDLNVRTGMSGLIRQMMDAVLQKYAVHEIIWKPTAEGVTAELRRVPLYFFENRTGKLKFVGVENRADGMPLEEDGWMVTVGDGLGEALAILYMFKRLGVQDLISFSEKFSIPGVLGRTSAKKGSDEGNAMRDSVLDYANEWVGVTYSDDGSIKSPIEIMQTPSSATLPPMSIIEYMDRGIATVVRGGDLSTISRGDGTGSNPQTDELDALLQDDCAMISETLQTQLDRLVIRMVHGDVKPAAYIVVNPPSDEDLTRELAIDTGLVALGVKQAPADVAERYGREMVEAPAETVKVVSDQSAEISGNAAVTANADEYTYYDPQQEAMDYQAQALRDALAADMKPLGDALYAASQAGDEAAMRAALRKIAKDMPELAGDAENLADVMADQFTAALMGEEMQAAENGDLPGHPFRGNQWNSRAREIAKGKAAAEKILVTHEDQIGAFTHPELGPIDFRWGNSKGGIQHIEEKHGRETVLQLPQMIMDGKVRRADKRVYVEAEQYTVMFATDYFNSPSNHWVLTGYMHHEKRADETGAG